MGWIRHRTALVLLLAVLGWSYVQSQQSSQSRVLVLIDSPTVKETHSDFLSSLEKRGHQLDVRMADDASLALSKFGKPLYEHLILLAPSVEEFGGSVSVAEIASFIDAGGNVVVTGGQNLGEAIRDLATEVGFEFDDSSTAVIDHNNWDSKLVSSRYK